MMSKECEKCVALWIMSLLIFFALGFVTCLSYVKHDIEYQAIRRGYAVRMDGEFVWQCDFDQFMFEKSLTLGLNEVLND